MSNSGLGGYRALHLGVVFAACLGQGLTSVAALPAILIPHLFQCPPQPPKGSFFLGLGFLRSQCSAMSPERQLVPVCLCEYLCDCVYRFVYLCVHLFEMGYLGFMSGSIEHKVRDFQLRTVRR